MKASVSVRAVGVVWYGSKEAYVWARANMEDGEMMPRAYGAWKQNAKAVLRNLKTDASAGLIERVEIKPVEFKAWCEANGLGLNAFSRTKYVSEIATEVARSLIAGLRTTQNAQRTLELNKDSPST